MYATDPESTAEPRDPAASAGRAAHGWDVHGHSPAGSTGPGGSAQPAGGGQDQPDRPAADRPAVNPGAPASQPTDAAAGGTAPGGDGSGSTTASNSPGGAQAANPADAGARAAGGGAGNAPSGAAVGAGWADVGAQADLKAALAAAEARAQESHEQYLRALADMENVRRRAQEDVSKAHKFAIEAFAESMLPVRDSLEMALTVEVPSVESLREGVEATLRQLVNAFERNKVVVIDPLHQKFDPHLHQAISMAPSRNVAPNHVVAVLQKGYMINERILRPALVTVSQAT